MTMYPPDDPENEWIVGECSECQKFHDNWFWTVSDTIDFQHGRRRMKNHYERLHLKILDLIKENVELRTRIIENQK